MKDYLTDANALSCPWIESPFFEDLLRNTETVYTDSEISKLIQFNETGYIVLEDVLSPEECDAIIADMSAAIDNQAYTKQDERYEYSNSPRVFEAWKTSKSVLDLARNKKILSTLELLYGRKAIPFQTINFKRSTNQPLHSDAIHFQTVPYNWMVGTWTALEDVSVTSTGTLKYVPGSHKWPFYQFQDIDVQQGSVPGTQFEAYAEYENFLKSLVLAKQADEHTLTIPKGSTIIWAANLLHGGTAAPDPSLTRWSQATHYYFEGCEHYYCPLFSDYSKGQYAEKDLSTKDILNHTI